MAICTLPSLNPLKIRSSPSTKRRDFEGGKKKVDREKGEKEERQYEEDGEKGAIVGNVYFGYKRIDVNIFNI